MSDSPNEETAWPSAFPASVLPNEIALACPEWPAVYEDLDNRYIRWEAVAQRLLTDLSLEEKALSGKDLRAYRHETKKRLRDSRAEYESAITEYGSEFRRS